MIFHFLCIWNNCCKGAKLNI